MKNKKEKSEAKKTCTTFFYDEPIMLQRESDSFLLSFPPSKGSWRYLVIKNSHQWVDNKTVRYTTDRSYLYDAYEFSSYEEALEALGKFSSPERNSNTFFYDEQIRLQHGNGGYLLSFPPNNGSRRYLVIEDTYQWVDNKTVRSTTDTSYLYDACEFSSYEEALEALDALFCGKSLREMWEQEKNSSD